MKRVIGGVSAILFGFAVYLYLDDDIDTRQSGDLRIATVNLYYGNREMPTAVQQLLDSRSDLLFLSEWSGNRKAMQHLINGGYRLVFNQPKRGTHGMALLLREGWSAEALAVANTRARACRIPILSARIEGPYGVFALIGVHAPPPVQACGEDNLESLQLLSSLVRDGRLRKDFGVARQGDPVVMLGDFNALPFSERMQWLRQEAGLRDAYTEAGRWPGASWTPWSPYLPRLARIDYQLVSAEFEVRRYASVGLPGSDHDLLVADYRRPGG